MCMSLTLLAWPWFDPRDHCYFGLPDSTIPCKFIIWNTFLVANFYFLHPKQQSFQQIFSSKTFLKTLTASFIGKNLYALRNTTVLKKIFVSFYLQFFLQCVFHWLSGHGRDLPLESFDTLNHPTAKFHVKLQFETSFWWQTSTFSQAAVGREQEARRCVVL